MGEGRGGIWCLLCGGGKGITHTLKHPERDLSEKMRGVQQQRIYTDSRHMKINHFQAQVTKRAIRVFSLVGKGSRISVIVGSR